MTFIIHFDHIKSLDALRRHVAHTHFVKRKKHLLTSIYNLLIPRSPLKIILMFSEMFLSVSETRDDGFLNRNITD